VGGIKKKKTNNLKRAMEPSLAIEGGIDRGDGVLSSAAQTVKLEKGRRRWPGVLIKKTPKGGNNEATGREGNVGGIREPKGSPEDCKW